LKPSAKILIALLILFALAVVLFHAKKTDQVAENRDRLEIYFMYNEGESQSDWFAAAAEKFKSMHPGLRIDILYAGREVLGKLRPRMIIGNPPDLVNQGGDQLRPLMEDDLFEPLDDALAGPAFDSDTPWADTFINGILDVYKWKNPKTGEEHYYQIPSGLFCYIFFYNVDQFERLHLEPPRTWSEFLHVCQVLKDNGIEPLAADGTELGYNIIWYGLLLTRTTTVKHVLDTAYGRPGNSWTEKCFVDAARMVAELREKGYIMRGYEGSKWPSAQMQWVQGKCAVLYNGAWIPKEMKNKLPEGFRMGIFRAPIVEGYPDADYLVQDIGAECYAVPRGARNRDMAVEFLRFITSREESKGLADIDVPCATRGVPMPAALKGLDEMLAPPNRLVEGTAGITGDLADWYRIVARNEWSDLFLGHVGPEEMCRRVQDAQDRFYQRERALDRVPSQ